MEKLKIKDILEAVDGELICGNDDLYITEITTDSRKMHNGTLFIGIKGENFDGNDYAESFLQSGGLAVITNRKFKVEDKIVIYVENTRKALGDLAKYYLKTFNKPVIGITGSVGKTSTKDMVASVLASKLNVNKTQGNFNNDIGLPLTIFNTTKETEISVLEMGMNNLGEISRLADIARPEVAIITNIGTAHIGRLGSQQGILKAKLEILEKLNSNGLVILNGDDKLLWGLKGKLPFKTVYYGIENDKCDFVAYDIVLGVDKSKFKVDIDNKTYTFTVNVIGEHNVYNALAGIICGLHYNLSVDDIIKGVANFITSGMRQRMEVVNGVTFIEDCYNASAASMEASIIVLDKIGGSNRKVAVLGDMLELGSYSEQAHRYVGKCVVKNNIDLLVVVGNDAQFIADEVENAGGNAVRFFDNKSATQYLKNNLQKQDTVLFKASRGMKLEEIIDALKQE